MFVFTHINIGEEKKFKNLLISDDLSMKSLKYPMKENTIKAFKAGCNLVLHCNGKMKEMNIVAENSPKVNLFIRKKGESAINTFPLNIVIASADL